jgi:hypothetical protein
MGPSPATTCWNTIVDAKLTQAIISKIIFMCLKADRPFLDFVTLVPCCHDKEHCRK